MRLTATELRKNLFSVLEEVVRGRAVEVSYKGASLRIMAAGTKSKLARAKRQPILLCEPDDIVRSDKQLLAQMEAEWEKDWKSL